MRALVVSGANLLSWFGPASRRPAQRCSYTCDRSPPDARTPHRHPRSRGGDAAERPPTSDLHRCGHVSGQRRACVSRQARRAVERVRPAATGDTRRLSRRPRPGVGLVRLAHGTGGAGATACGPCCPGRPAGALARVGDRHAERRRPARARRQPPCCRGSSATEWPRVPRALQPPAPLHPQRRNRSVVGNSRQPVARARRPHSPSGAIIITAMAKAPRAMTYQVP